jgi:hypothetical protein
MGVPFIGEIGKILKPVTDLVDKLHSSTPEKLEAQTKLETARQALTKMMLDLSGKIILAEAGGSKLQRNWRPIVMLSFAFIPFNNYVIYPYFVGHGAVMLELDPEIWELLKLGLGGYIGLRSTEKIVGKVSDYKLKKLAETMKNSLKGENNE